jgi:hypothetical protein
MSEMSVQIKERPILFSGEMIKALVEGRKTQTRRVVKALVGDENPANQVCEDGGGNWIAWYGMVSKNLDMAAETKRQYPNGEGFKCPYGEPGERLWCRETWFNNNGEGDQDPEQIFYRADGENGGADFEGETIEGDGGGWSQSNHMPRWASRILLEVVSVRVERLQAITEADARAEGIKYPPLFADEPCPSDEYARKSYAGLWNSINGLVYPWQSNPFVWVVEFKVLEVKAA